MPTDRQDPRRVAVLSLFIVAAIAWAWQAADDGAGDVLRFVLGFGTGLVLAAATRWADGMLSGRLDFSDRTALARAGMTVGPVLGVLGGLALARYGGLDENLSVTVAGACAGLIAGVGVLYPLP